MSKKMRAAAWALMHIPNVFVDIHTVSMDDDSRDMLVARLVGTVVYADDENHLIGDPEAITIRVQQPVGTNFAKDDTVETVLSDTRYKLSFKEVSEFSEETYQFARAQMLGALGLAEGSAMRLQMSNCQLTTDITARIALGG